MERVRREDVRAECVPVSLTALRYLCADDGARVPPWCAPKPRLAGWSRSLAATADESALRALGFNPALHVRGNGDDDDDEDEEDDVEGNEEDGRESGGEEGRGRSAEETALRAFTAALDAAVRAVGGRAVVKTCGRMPRDAADVLGGRIWAAGAGDAIALLKTSERCGAALQAALEHGGGRGVEVLVAPYLADLNPLREWRLFVYGGELVALCQRDPSVYDPGLPAGLRAAAEFALAAHDAALRAALPWPDGVLDVELQPDRGVVRLLDVAPWGVPTDPLLFDWAEIACARGAGLPAVRMLADLPPIVPRPGRAPE